jgi:hypothetical protein
MSWRGVSNRVRSPRLGDQDHGARELDPAQRPRAPGGSGPKRLTRVRALGVSLSSWKSYCLGAEAKGGPYET